jgi:hypothetical protein
MRVLCVDLVESPCLCGGLEDWMHEAVAHDDRGEQVKFWRFCTMVLSAGLMVSLLTHSGPREAGASEMGYGDAPLRIGGFDAVDGEAVFVIEDESGARVGVLAMQASSANDSLSFSD